MHSTLKYLFCYFKSIFQPAVKVSDADAAGVFFDLLASQCNDDGHQLCKDQITVN